MIRTLLAGAAALVVLGCGTAAQAAGDITAYPASYFAPAQPYSALDMVQRLPGFTLKEGDADVRGLAGAAGNVLVDGERPPTKQESLSDLLRRIPAASVERIELIRGGVDMQGQTLLANVVRVKKAQASGQAEVSTFAYRDGRIAPAVSVQQSLRQGDRLIEGSARLYRGIDDDKGAGPRRRFAEDGSLLREIHFREEAGSTGVSLKGAYEQRLLGGKLALHGAFDEDHHLADLREQRTFPTSVLTLQTEHEDLRAGELGANYDRSFGAAKLTVTAVQRLSRTLADERADTEGEIELFTSRAKAGESILRASLQRPLSDTLRVEGGAEGAFTFLDGAVSLEEDGETVDLPAANVRVEELRGEAFATVDWQARPNLSLEAGLRAETSQLRQSGDSQLEKRLTYFKPRARLAWDMTAARQLRLRIEREVGQLDFEDFTSSASLSAGTVSAGNEDLEPQTQWVVEAEFEQRLSHDGAVVLALRHIAIDNVVDRAPLTGGGQIFDGPGNVGEGRQDEFELSFTLPLRWLPGALLTGEATWRRSSVQDPTTGEDREISDVRPLEGEIHFTQDLPAHAFRWGADIDLAERKPEYRFDEVRISRTGAMVSLFSEWTLPRAWRLRLDARNLTSRAEQRVRDIYEGPRAFAPLDYREDRTLDIGAYAGVTLRRSY